MRREDLIEFWGRDELKRWPESGVVHAAIPEASKRFLTDVGLPHKVDWTIRFDPAADSLPRLPDRPACRRIGFDDQVPICLDESCGGSVVSVDGETGVALFINSSVRRFAVFLALYQRYRRLVYSMPEDEAAALIADTSERMRVEDPDAVADPRNWWPIILEQMRDGLL